MSILDVSVVIITKDDAARVGDLVRKLESHFSDIVVLIDDRSGLDVEEQLNGVKCCRCKRFKFEGFGAAKREVVSMAKHEWVFSLDADEIPDELCLKSIEMIDYSKPSIYKFKRLNHYCDRPIKACGWYPDFVIRLFHREVAGFTNDVVHESVKPHGETKICELAGHIKHYSFNGSHQLLQKLLNYSTLYAENYSGKPKSVVTILLRTKIAFLKFYLLKKGFMYGRDGFIISLMNAGGVFHKHWRAAELQRK